MKKYQQMIPMQPDEKIFIKAHATLDVEGWEKQETWIETDLNVHRIRREDGGLYLLFVDDATVKVPRGSRLFIEKASGNARVRKMSGDVVINGVSGNLAVQQVRNVQITRVSGGCLVQTIESDLEVHGVGGNLKGKDCMGMVRADRISAGVELLSLHSGADVRAMGDIHLSFLADSKAPVHLRSSASISIHLPFELNAEMSIKTNAHLTELTLGDRHEKIHHRKHVLLVGEGRRKFELEAGGKVSVIAEKFEDNEMLALFEELETLWAELKRENLARREAELVDAADADHVDISQEEMKAADQRVQAALQQVNSRLQAMGYEPGAEPGVVTPPGTPQGGDLTGERLIIMRMLGEKRITLEEADKLLEALDG